jgi:hypothetical protein
LPRFLQINSAARAARISAESSLQTDFFRRVYAWIFPVGKEVKARWLDEASFRFLELRDETLRYFADNQNDAYGLDEWPSIC